jgi:hypothetical protein
MTSGAQTCRATLGNPQYQFARFVRLFPDNVSGSVDKQYVRHKWQSAVLAVSDWPGITAAREVDADTAAPQNTQALQRAARARQLELAVHLIERLERAIEPDS